jgi:hypothetical protein
MMLVEDVLNVDSSLSVRVQVLELSRDGDGATRLGLLESNDSLNGGVSLEDSDSLVKTTRASSQLD